MKLLVAALGLALMSTPAFAWDAFVDGPDVFGKTRVIAGEESVQSMLVVQCESDGDTMIALTFGKKAFDDVTEQAADLYFAASDDAPRKLAAKLRSWNDNRGGVVAVLDGDDLKAVITAISEAKGKIKVGADISGNKIADNFSSRGSTSAMKKVIDGCKLALN